MTKVLDWPRQSRWHAGVDRLILSATVVSLWSVVVAYQTAVAGESDQQCAKTRELVTTVWGGVFILFVLSFDSWGFAKAHLESFSHEALWEVILFRFVVFVVIILSPMIALWELVESGLWSYHTRRRMPGFTVWSLLPWTKSPAKIVSNCAVVITVPATTSIPDRFLNEDLPCLSEALVIGRRQEEPLETSSSYSLANRGREVLLGMDVLPPYDQLKFVQGNSGFATIISAVQSIGYIYGVVVRTIQGLPVSPLEVVAVTLSIMILIKAVLHSIGSTCHRPLHVYLTHDEALTFAQKCQEVNAHEFPSNQVFILQVVMALLLSSVTIFYIIHMWRTTRIVMILPILSTLLGFYVPFLPNLTNRDNLILCIWMLSGIMFITSYTFALVVTIKYWKVDRLNAKTSSMVAQLFPYIG